MSRLTEIEERLRAGTLEHVFTDIEYLLGVAKAAGPALDQWLAGRADWNEGRGAMTTEERALFVALHPDPGEEAR